jgi:hypothetical protein
MDRHKLWRLVEHDYEQMKKRAPEGLEPVVEVFLAGRETPVELGWVETRRGDDDVWVRFESPMPAAADGSETQTLPAEGYWVHVHESAVLRVELRFRRPDGPQMGFRYTVDDDE